MSKVELVWVTPNAEDMIAYTARVSSIPNQRNPEYKKLFRYCLEHGHWSVFQMGHMCVGVETSLAVAVQMMRHWSLSIHEPLDIQQYSQRYANPLADGLEFQPIELRKKATSNRQSSAEPLDVYSADICEGVVSETLNQIRVAHEVLVQLGVANEVARMILPQATTTRFFVSGSVRSWIHYLGQRDDVHAQLEHRLLAQEIKGVFVECFPLISEILGYKTGDSDE